MGSNMSDNNVVSLFPRTDEQREKKKALAKEKMLATLSHLLEQVMADQVVALALVAFPPNDQFMYTALGEGDYTKFVGGVEELKFQIQLAHMTQYPARVYDPEGKK